MGSFEQTTLIGRTKGLQAQHSIKKDVISDLLHGLVEWRMNPMTIADVLQAQFQEEGLLVETLAAETVNSLMELLTHHSISLNIEDLLFSLTQHPLWPEYLSARAATGCLCFFVLATPTPEKHKVVETCAQIVENLWKGNSIRLTRADKLRIVNTLKNSHKNAEFWKNSCHAVQALNRVVFPEHSKPPAHLHPIDNFFAPVQITTTHVVPIEPENPKGTTSANVQEEQKLLMAKFFLSVFQADELSLCWDLVKSLARELGLVNFPQKWEHTENFCEALCDPAASSAQLECLGRWFLSESCKTCENVLAMSVALNQIEKSLMSSKETRVSSEKLLSLLQGMLLGVQDSATEAYAAQGQHETRQHPKALHLAQSLALGFMPLMCVIYEKLSLKEKRTFAEIFLGHAQKRNPTFQKSTFHKSTFQKSTFQNDNFEKPTFQKAVIKNFLSRENLNWVRALAENQWDDEIKTFPLWLQKNLLRWSKNIFLVAPQSWLNCFAQEIFQCLQELELFIPPPHLALLVRQFRKKSPAFACRPQSILALAYLLEPQELSTAEQRSLTLLQQKLQPHCANPSVDIQRLQTFLKTSTNTSASRFAISILLHGLG